MPTEPASPTRVLVTLGQVFGLFRRDFRHEAQPVGGLDGHPGGIAAAPRLANLSTAVEVLAPGLETPEATVGLSSALPPTATFRPTIGFVASLKGGEVENLGGRPGIEASS
jgi:hypothetical protein